MADQVHLEDFCAVCGTTIPGDPDHPHLHRICGRCHAEGTSAILERTSHDGSGEIIGGSWDGNKVKLVTYINDLGPSRRPASIDRWPEKVFEVLSLSKRSSFPATCWTFYASMLPALERIIESTGRTLVVYDRD